MDDITKQAYRFSLFVAGLTFIILWGVVITPKTATAFALASTICFLVLFVWIIIDYLKGTPN